MKAGKKTAARLARRVKGFNELAKLPGYMYHKPGSQNRKK